MNETGLQAGVTLQGRRASYRLVRRLGGGRYSEVWQADVEGELWLEVAGREHQPVQQIALKAMNRGLIPAEQRHFESEIGVLRQLQSYEGQHDLLVDGHSLVPTVFEARNEAEAAPHPAFFAGTLATGRPLDELMREQGAFPEPGALTIVAQFCRVLEALHRGVGRGYLDFQPKNVFWDEQTGRILVIDWNLLSRRGETGFKDDLTAAAKMLYRLLMGVEPPGAGSPRLLAQPLEQWKRLSLGAQDILTRAFHPNAGQRFPDASEFRRKQEELIGLWELPPGSLVATVKDYLPPDVGRRALSANSKDRLSRAATMISVAERQEPIQPEVASRIADLRSQVEAWMVGRGHLENGRRLFDAKDYSAALEDFRAATKEAWDTETALEAVRWEQVVTAMEGTKEQLGALDPGAARHGVTVLGEGQYEAVISLLRPLSEQPGAETLRHLASEASIGLALREVERLEAQQKYREAAEKCQQATTLQAGLPRSYAELSRERWGQLTERAKSLYIRAEQFERVQSLVSQVEDAFARSFEEGEQELEGALAHEPGHPDLVALAERRARGLLKAGKYDQARSLTGLALHYIPPGDLRQSVVVLDTAASALTDAQRAHKGRDWYMLKRASTRARTLEEGARHIASLRESFFADAERADDFLWAKLIATLMDETERKRVAKRLEALKEEFREAWLTWFARDFEAALEELRRLLVVYPDDEDLLAIAQDVASDYFDQKQYEQARRIAALTVELKTLRELAAGLVRAQQAWKEQDQDGLQEAIALARQYEEGVKYATATLRAYFVEARDAGDYPRAQMAFDSMDKATQAKFKRDLDRLRKDWQAGVGQALQRTENATRQAEKALEEVIETLDQVQAVNIALETVGAALPSAETWELRSAAAGWIDEGEKLDRALQDLRAVQGSLEKVRADFKTSRMQVVERLWPLVFETSPSHESPALSIQDEASNPGPSNPGPGAASATSGAGSAEPPVPPVRLPRKRRLALLNQILAACRDLLQGLPNDPDTVQWQVQQVRAQSEQRALQGWKRIWRSRWVRVGAPIVLAVLIAVGGFAAGMMFASWQGDGKGPAVTPTVILEPTPTRGPSSAELTATAEAVLASDEDGDGLSLQEEEAIGTDPSKADSDADGLTDYEELQRGTDPLAADSDGDDLNDGDEIERGTDPANADSDADGLEDGDEAQRGTDPLAADSDGDGLDDGDEAARGTDPANEDTDGDDVSDGDEAAAGTNPLATPTPLPVNMMFPVRGASYPVMPWQVIINSTELAMVTLLLEPVEPLEAPISVMLGGQPVDWGLAPIVLVDSVTLEEYEEGYIYRWEQAIDDLQELPDGQYRLRVQLDVDADDQPNGEGKALEFEINSILRVPAVTNTTILVFSAPSGESQQMGTVANGTSVLVLGRVDYPTTEEVWCLFEVEEDSMRYWRQCDYLTLEDGRTIKEAPEEVPAIGPSQTER